ncbi:uncharacterized protein [Osmerus mordax]|uniref:uncharacterized protein n=1 Tax=Osmerus mordax TaxID=8014 RepID=UPI00350F4243
MRNLDSYTPRLLNIMRAKGGVPGTKIRPILDTLNQRDSIERRRDAVIRSLIEYLGESGVELFLDCQEADRHENTHHILKVLVLHAATDEDPVDVSIIIEGNEVLTKCDNTAKACTLLMGLLYALNLEYPAKLKYTFEVFQKLFLELDGIKLSSKVQSPYPQLSPTPNSALPPTQPYPQLSPTPNSALPPTQPYLQLSPTPTQPYPYQPDSQEGQ